jgi:hypothetical protein
MSCPICNKTHACTIDQALKSLAATARRLERLVYGMKSGPVSARPAPDKWSIKEIVCHLADCEVAYGWRYRKIISEPGAVIPPFDQNAWAENLRYREQPLKEALATYKILRSGHLTRFKNLSKAAWNKVGVHPSYGKITLRQMVVHIADHDRNHVAQVARLSGRTGK